MFMNVDLHLIQMFSVSSWSLQVLEAHIGPVRRERLYAGLLSPWPQQSQQTIVWMAASGVQWVWSKVSHSMNNLHHCSIGSRSAGLNYVHRVRWRVGQMFNYSYWGRLKVDQNLNYLIDSDKKVRYIFNYPVNYIYQSGSDWAIL